MEHGRKSIDEVLGPDPAGIYIPQAPVKARKKLPMGRILLAVVAVLGGWMWFSSWYGDYDDKRIKPVVTQALLAHATKGTRLPVTLWSGPRIIQIGTTLRANPVGPGQIPTTCVELDVLDPKTGQKDPKYPYGDPICIDGIAVTIR